MHPMDCLHWSFVVNFIILNNLTYIIYIDRDFNSLYTDQKFKQFHQDLTEIRPKLKGHTFKLQFVVATYLRC